MKGRGKLVHNLVHKFYLEVILLISGQNKYYKVFSCRTSTKTSANVFQKINFKITTFSSALQKNEIF